MADINDSVNAFTNTADSTSQFSQDDIKGNMVVCIFAYISWLVIIPILAAPNSKYARFHSNQGLILAILEIIFGAVFAVLGIIPFIGIVFSIIGGIFGLFFLILSIIGIVNVVNGKAKDIPILGKIRILK